MKKIAFFIAAAAMLASCTKWENKSTEFKVTGVWTGVSQQVNIQALPLLDSTDIQNTPYLEANFMDNGGLTIDSSGTRIDSLGWSIKNDTILTLKGIDMGLGLPGGGGSGATNLDFVIKTLEQDAFVFRVDTSITLSIPGIPFPVTLEVAQIQRWGK